MRIAKGLVSAVDHAKRIGCEAIQIFSSNPNSWRISELDLAAADAFREATERARIGPVILHTPYLLNLASTKDGIWSNTIRLLSAALMRAHYIGGDYVVTHIGSHGGAGFEAGADRVALAVADAIQRAEGGAMVLLEAGSGAGNSVGSTFEELAAILQRLEGINERVGVCLDTAHLWGAGYDLSSHSAVESVFSQFDRLIGLNRLRVIHCNDTLKALGSKIDRHWHIGEGNIGLEGFLEIVNHPGLSGVAGIIETPEAETGKDIVNLNRLKELRYKSE